MNEINRPPISLEALDRVLAGDAMPEEQQSLFMALVADGRLDASMDDAIQRLRFQGAAVPSAEQIETARIALRKMLDDDLARTSRSDRSGLRLGRRRAIPVSSVTPGQLRMLGTAILGAIAITVAIAREWNPPISKDVATTRTYVTRAGEQRTVSIGDGSSVVLGPATTMTVGLSDRGRLATVQGQALVSLVHSATLPFTVRVGKADVRVLGTTFVVRNYPSDSATRVVVGEGRVSVSSGMATPVVLTAGTLAIIGDSGRIAIGRNAALDEETSWTKGRLSFRDTPAREMVKDLGRVYDVDIRISDSILARRTFTWSVPVANRSLPDVLDVLVHLFDARYTRTGRIITIVPDAAGSTPRSRERSLPSTLESQYGR
jgi:ferric-dicitrate binding protein FerR (iron transport regulator)